MNNQAKFLLNQKFFEENVKETKRHNQFDNFGYSISKGINKLKRTFSSLFSDEKKTKKNGNSNV
jgi:hypothetical protein